MTDERCRLFEDCLAPLCPLDPISLKGVWYSDEEICRSRSHGNLSWIRAQRKIARVKAEGYFTLEMLRDIRTARKGMAGLDPNEDEQAQLCRWFGRHEKKRSGLSRNRKETPMAVYSINVQQADLFAQSSGGPAPEVSALLPNVAKQGPQGKNRCRNRGGQAHRPEGDGQTFIPE
jgi:hypothetical protein